MYQKCPKCNGEGIIEIPSLGTLVNKQETCSVCKGERIIHTESGLPPSLHNTRISSKPMFSDKDAEKKENLTLGNIINSTEFLKEGKMFGFMCPFVNEECPFIDTAGMIKTQDCGSCNYPSKKPEKRKAFKAELDKIEAPKFPEDKEEGLYSPLEINE